MMSHASPKEAKSRIKELHAISLGRKLSEAVCSPKFIAPEVAARHTLIQRLADAEAVLRSMRADSYAARV